MTRASHALNSLSSVCDTNESCVCNQPMTERDLARSFNVLNNLFSQ